MHTNLLHILFLLSFLVKILLNWILIKNSIHNLFIVFLFVQDMQIHYVLILYVYFIHLYLYVNILHLFLNLHIQICFLYLPKLLDLHTWFYPSTITLFLPVSLFYSKVKYFFLVMAFAFFLRLINLIFTVSLFRITQYIFILFGPAF